MIRQIVKNKVALFSVLILIVAVLFAIFAEFIAPYSPADQNIDSKLLPPVWDENGNSSYLLGTDELGRDVLSRIIHGSRVSLVVSLFGTLFALVIGTIIGAISGYYGGKVDAFLMRLVDIVLAFPFILLAIFVIAITGPSVLNIIIVAGFATGVNLARIIRGEVLHVKENDFIEATHSIGANNFRIIMLHILPNIANVLIVIATLEMANLILLESALSFLGLGVPAEVPTWGKMLAESRTLIISNPWNAIFPGIAITITVLGINLFGDWLRDYFDPKYVEK
ncbi:ABC transporter permease [Oceanobacillus oncorhynchi]|uniref:ABC transporter permease n=1 Tax=Oceanobacillus oncorhynchi TaxID=545501 RepID=UPI001868B07D|nr:ABC transporter permease [Oceanobacillus oncorhynchi]